jgi:hypothetical protein
MECKRFVSHDNNTHAQKNFNERDTTQSKNNIECFNDDHRMKGR